MIEQYEKLRLTTDIVILTTEDCSQVNKKSLADKKLQVMLVKRDIEPFLNMWSIPGGFVDIDKGIDEVVDSKLFKKTGISNIYKEQLYTYGNDVHRDPRDRVVTVAYIALVSKHKIKNLSGGEWFWVDVERSNNGEVAKAKFTRQTTGEVIDNLAFDHSKIIIDALNRISNKLMYTDIGFELVNDVFTLKELQMAFEVVSGKPIPSFRRIMEPRLVDTGLLTSDIKDKRDSFRPAHLYRKRS